MVLLTEKQVKGRLIRIEPDWNVNGVRCLCVGALNDIRIEPDWNVNDLIGSNIRKGINN